MNSFSPSPAFTLFCRQSPALFIQVTHKSHTHKPMHFESKMHTYCQNTQEVKNGRFLIWTRQNNMRIFSKCCHRQSDEWTNGYKTRNVVKALSSISLFEIVGEKVPPSQTDRVWKLRNHLCMTLQHLLNNMLKIETAGLRLSVVYMRWAGTCYMSTSAWMSWMSSSKLECAQ